MPAPYCSEVAKVRDMPEMMKYISGRIADVGCGPDKITLDAIGFDGRELDGVDFKKDGCWITQIDAFDTIFSSHFLEHTPDQFAHVLDWYHALKLDGYLVLYLPDGRHYNNHENLEHMVDMNYDQFMFWFRRVWCGEGRDFRGRMQPRFFKLIDHGMDIGDDRYSFYVVAQKA